jgi:hypothetical protein
LSFCSTNRSLKPIFENTYWFHAFWPKTHWSTAI